ncbi:BMP family ABC transporter substrate-binding protein [Pseudonocardiaceae bacterium YIM PH 21723]|nr:BMP family ABC transporter substrate-binding protein [Pseudonocardiaceae bacterium YIM PH 21723]
MLTFAERRISQSGYLTLVNTPPERIRSGTVRTVCTGQPGRGATVRRLRGLLAIPLLLLSLTACVKDDPNAISRIGKGAACTRNSPPAAPPSSSSTTTSAEPVSAPNMRVGLAYDIGGRGDTSFNDLAAAGIDRAKAELGVTDVRELSAAAGESPSAQVARLRGMALEGFNPIVAVGFAYTDGIKQVSKEFPNVKFGLVDSVVEAPNVSSLIFAEEQGSFFAGVMAAYKSRSCHVGFIGGVDIPLIHKFEAGFVQGAKAVAPGIQIERKYLSPAGDTRGFNDPGKGNEATRGQIDAGADVIYHGAGASAKGIFDAAKAGGALGIGCDADQYQQPTLAGVKDIIIGSALKKVDVAVFDFIRAVALGKTADLPKVFDLRNDGVGYSASGGKINDMIPVLEAYKAQIVSGKLTVSQQPTR